MYAKCINYVRFRNKECRPKDVPLPNYSKIDKELAWIDKEEEEWLKEFKGLSIQEAKELNKLLDKLRGQ